MNRTGQWLALESAHSHLTDMWCHLPAHAGKLTMKDHLGVPPLYIVKIKFKWKSNSSPFTHPTYLFGQQIKICHFVYSETCEGMRVVSSTSTCRQVKSILHYFSSGYPRSHLKTSEKKQLKCTLLTKIIKL